MTSCNADERRSARARVLLSATVQWQGRSISVKVANLSAHGARVTSAGLPGQDTAVVFCCNNVAIEGWIAWLEGPLAGINFGSQIDAAKILRKAPAPKAPIVKDNRMRDFRRPGFRGNQLTRHESDKVNAYS